MHYSTFDQYRHQDTLIHELDPRVKLLLTLFFILMLVLLPDGAWLAYGISYGLVLMTIVLAQISLSYVLKRTLIVLPFLLAAVTVLFTLPGDVLVILPLGLTISDAGLVRFLSIVIRSLVAIQMAILLTATTPFPDILHGLRHLKVPAILVSIIAFMYRYLFVLADEAGRLLRGRAARSAAHPHMPGRAGGTLGWRAKVTGNMIGQLFLRSLDRSDRVYNAMLARGYQGELLTINPHRMHGRDWAVLLSYAGLITAVLLLGYL